MKPAIHKILVLVALLTIPASTLYAQQTGAGFSVPFDFLVNGQSLPAGDYFIESMWWNAVAFHHGKGEANLIILGERGPRTQDVQTKLIFHRYDSQYILASAELPNTDQARTFQTGVVSHVIKVGKTAQARPEIVEIAGK
jgi:hypothetical protein